MERNRLNFGVLFSKIDVENRVVSGFATLDNVDSHGDIVESAGSRRAFERFRGGLREMHTNNAVGTLVDFESIKKYSMEDDTVYDGIYVNARVSKGAQDTWEKVLDGTFKGFSIGGKINERVTTYDDAGNPIGVIRDYDLIELSLVDNPANPLATVMTVRKIGDTFVYNDDDMQKLNVFYHAESGDVVLSADESRDEFEHIGWVDSPDDTQKLRDMVNAHKLEKGYGPSIPQNDVDVLLKETDAVMMDNNTEGGANVADVQKQADDVAVEETADETTEVVEKAADVDETSELETVEDVEKAADVAEVEDEQDDVVEKVTAAVTATVTEAVEAALSKAAEAAKESKDAVTSVETSFGEALKSLETKLSKLEENLSKSLNGLADRVEEVESGTAIKKSADVIDDDDDEAEGETNFWRGSGFLSVNDLMKA